MLKLLGALLIIAGCGFIGSFKVITYKKEVEYLKQFISILDYISCTLLYQLIPLSDICRQVSDRYIGKLGNAFLCFAEELDNQVAPDIIHCIEAALTKQKDIPRSIYNCMIMLGRNLGHFGLDGQLKGIEEVRADCEGLLRKYTENQDVRLRAYQTLSLCAGAAIAILFI